MISIKWIITDDLDDLSSVSVEEFDNEWNGIIEGYFELIVNEQRVGFCPNREIEKGEDGFEDILFWLAEFNRGLKKVKKGEVFEMRLITMNLYKLILLKKREKVELQYTKKETNQIDWKEEVEMQEFEQEINCKIEKFKNEIQCINANLLTSKWIKKLEY